MRRKGAFVRPTSEQWHGSWCGGGLGLDFQLQETIGTVQLLD
jgi:hypothetical protein